MKKNRRRKRFKKKVKPKKARNFIAMYACLRKAGAMKNKKKELERKICRRKVNETKDTE